MKAADWMDSENYRNRLVAELMEFCTDRGLDTVAEGDKLIIDLPTIQEINVWPEAKKRKVFDISTWGDRGVDENEITNLPENGEILEEGEPPKGDKGEY